MSTVESWYVTVTLAGPSRPPEEVAAAVGRLVDERPFLHSCRYDIASVELGYWDQGVELEDVAALALRLWGEHRVSAQLPPWHVVGLQVIDRATYRKRRADGTAAVTAQVLSDVVPS